MQFKITVTFPDGSSQCDWLDLHGAEGEVKRLSELLPALAPGERIEIVRIS